MSSPSRTAVRRKRLNPRLVAEIRRGIGAGTATVNGWAQELAVPWATVASAAYGWTWRSVSDPPPLTPPEPDTYRQRPAALPYARLTEKAVAAMRRSYRSGLMSLAQLADEYGVAESTVRNAVMGFTWRHVAEPPAERRDRGGRTRVTAEDEQEILKRRAARHTFRRIAADLDIDHTVVYRACKRLTTGC